MYKFIFLPFIKDFHFLNVFQYITFRMGLSALTAMILTFIFGPWVIRKLRAWKMGAEIRSEKFFPVYEQHKGKQGTPTMGGILFVGSVVVSSLLWADITHPYVLIAILGIVLFGLIGFVDDYAKFHKKKSQGLSAKQKFLAQALLSLGLGIYLMGFSEIKDFATTLHFPFVKGELIDCPAWVWLIFIVLVIVGTSNAVNLTDGLDGLAIGCTVIASLAFTIMTYVIGNKVFCDYLLLEYVRESAELSVFCSAMVGAGLGFLWWNANPAQVFMGDTGALSIGGAFGLIAILIKKELYLLLIGGVFVMEALSVILQVGCFKVFRKRIFLCAPIHHHFQMKGWSEPNIVVRFWILAVIFALLGMVSLKFR
jgi:phospho-N-acetylmuramoyl-pentapeptide-transferase